MAKRKTRLTPQVKKQMRAKRAAVDYVPHQYQEDLLARMDETGMHALLLDPGMGKTSICLEDFRRRFEIMDANRALVVAPLKTAQATWPAEVLKWKQFNHLSTRVLHGKHKTIEAAQAADITIINPEGLKWLASVAPKMDQWFDVVYVDESTMFKTASSQRSKALYRVIHKIKGGIPYRFILTGTPAPNGIADLYGQFGALDPQILGKTLAQFRRDFKFHSRHAPWGTIWEPGKESEELIYNAIGPHSVRLDASDHLNMPDLVKTQRFVTLPPKARKVYKELEDEMFAETDSGEIIAVNPGVLSAKCRQVANGAVYLSELGEAVNEETRKIEYVHTAKAEELGRLWEELGRKPLLVAYEFQHDLTIIKHYMKNEFKFEPRYIGGGSTTEEVADSIEAWNAGELPMLLVNPASAAHGLNLQSGGHHLCWYSLTWNLEHYIQLNGRLWRQGQEKGVFVHHLIASKTIDEVVWKALEAKDATQLKLLSYLKDYRK